MVETALEEVDPPTPSPSPSTSSSLAMSQIQGQTQPAPEALKPADILPSIAFTVLWLFGLARNLASYIVSLGIIPFKTASRLFGLEKQQEQPAPRPRQDRERRNGHGSRYTSVHLEHVSPAEATNQPTGTKSVSHSSWLLQQHRPASGSATSSSSTVTTLRTSSVPSTPRHTPRSSYSLIPPIEVSTDSEQTKGRSKYRESLLSRRPNRQEEGTDDEDSKAKGRSRIDHSTRRILFVDSKTARRQTAPVPLVSSQDSSFVPASAHPHELSDSPAQATVTLPATDEPETDKRSHGKSSPPHSRPVSTNEFGELTAELDKGQASGAESISDKKGKPKERKRSAFKIFGRKRSNSVASVSTPAPAATAEPTPAVPLTSASTSRLRRRSPYPAKPGPCSNSNNNTNTRSVGVMTVSMSDAEVSSSAPASNSISWLRSRPKKLTKRTRSNSVCSIARSDSISSHTPLVSSSIAPPSILRGSLDDVPIMTNDLSPRAGLTVTTTAMSPLPPILASPVSSNPSPTSLVRASTSSSIPTSKPHPHPGSTTPSNKPRFNPLRDLEAHLYNRHGFGTGPSTSDAFIATPIPSGGIPRTKPYELLGIERPTSSSKEGKRRMSTLDKELVVDRDETTSVNAAKRASAPAGSLSVLKSENLRGRPTTPSRSQTQPL